VANSVTAPSGIGAALLPIDNCGIFIENSCDGDGKLGEDDGRIASRFAGGVVTTDGGEDKEITSVAVFAILPKRKMRQPPVMYVRVASMAVAPSRIYHIRFRKQL